MIWPGKEGKWHKLCPQCHSVQTYGRLRFARDRDRKGQLCRTCKWDDRYTHLTQFEIPTSWFNKYRLGAKGRGLEFSIVEQDVFEKLEKQGYKCALSGQDISFKTRRGKSHRASIDRIDSSKGYIRDNIQIVAKELNMMKLDHSQADFIELCKKVAEYNK